jgi:hypothetical protein
MELGGGEKIANVWRGWRKWSGVYSIVPDGEKVVSGSHDGSVTLTRARLSLNWLAAASISSLFFVE